MITEIYEGEHGFVLKAKQIQDGEIYQLGYEITYKQLDDVMSSSELLKTTLRTLKIGLDRGIEAGIA